MPDLTLVMLGAGTSSRFNQKAKKQWLRIDDAPLWLYATRNLAQHYSFANIIVTASSDDIGYMKKFSDTIVFAEGGNSRQASLKNALLHVKTPFVLVSDSARPCIDKGMLDRLLEHKADGDIIVPYINVADTVVYHEATINRDEVKLIQTPQLSRVSTLQKALETNIDYTDDSSAIQAVGGKVCFVLGDKRAHKLTCKEDLTLIPCLKNPSPHLLVGHGFDVHSFEEGKVMMLGGIECDKSIGFRAHSDGDVAIHALIDALLGASGAGDIGELFPDNDANYHHIDSKILLKKVCLFLEQVGFEIVHCDITIMAEFPRLAPFKDAMRFCLARIMGLEPIHVNIKATTTEKLGFIGRKEGVGVNAVATLRYYDWKNA